MAVSVNTVKKFNALSVDNKKLVVNLLIGSIKTTQERQGFVFQMSLAFCHLSL